MYFISLRCVGDEVPRQEIAASCTTQGMGNPDQNLLLLSLYRLRINSLFRIYCMCPCIYIQVYSEIWISQNEKLWCFKGVVRPFTVGGPRARMNINVGNFLKFRTPPRKKNWPLKMHKHLRHLSTAKNAFVLFRSVMSL